MSDEQVLWAIKKKDEKVMAAVIQKYSKLLWKVVSSVLVNAATTQDIEECVADTFIQFWMNADKYNPDKGKLSSYLSVIARSKAIDRYRQIVRHKEQSIEEGMFDCQSGLLEKFVSKEEKQKLLECIKKLDDSEREILVRRYFYEQKPKEIARALDMPGKQVENKLYSAKQKLRKMMEK